MITVSENIRRVGDTRRRPSNRTATRRGRPGAIGHDVHTPARLPDLLVTPIFISSPPPRAASDLSRSAIVAAELHHRRAHAPLQKRALHLHRSSAVFASTSSTT